MKTDNIFYIFDFGASTQLTNTSYDLHDGHIKTEEGIYGYPYRFDIREHNSLNYLPVFAPVSGYNYHSIQAIMFDKNDNYLGYRIYQYGPWTNLGKSVISIIENTAYIYFNVAITGQFINLNRNWIKVGYAVTPHYKQLKKKYSKENGQVFFRESLEGNVSLFDVDYNLVESFSIEDTIGFEIYKRGILYITASFNKSDCKVDYFRRKIELKLSYNDSYTKILDAYENTYDLIKLAPAIVPLTLTKRCVVQIYIQGENVISNYAGGTYWETEVDEPVDDEDMLIRKYHFAKGPKYSEVDLQGFNYDINAVYTGAGDSNIWNAVSIKEIDGTKYKIPCSIKFNKIASAGEYVIDGTSVRLLSSGTGNGLTNVGTEEYPQYIYKYDTYQIEIWTGKNGTGTNIYKSISYYGKDSNFMLAIGDDLYPMVKVSQPTPASEPSPSSFNLGEYVIEYQIWGRLLCDSDELLQTNQEPLLTYDLPRDDFATARRNYRKCIGLIGFDNPNSVIKIYQSQQAVDTPTSYGINDFGEYFEPPYTLYGQYFYPLARNTWANTSMWVMLDEMVSPAETGFEAWCSGSYKEYILKNSYHVCDVIKVLLAEIDPTITHEKTSEYSSFLYGHSGGTAPALGNCDIYITQKTNILKGEYDQAAQKAEIKFKQLMDMLRDCFKCYWFIDEQNRFRIEHVSYFMNGLSYDVPSIQIDLTTKRDSLNKKPPLYCQQEVEFDKTELDARYEFAWADDTTKAIGGDLHVDIKNAYIQKDKTQEINVDSFTSDIDYMLFLPDNFSNDGFALLLADENKKVPIVHAQIKDEKQYNRLYDVYVQNWYSSFNQLIQHYMKDMPGDNIEYNNINILRVEHVKRCKKHVIEFPMNNLSLNIYKMIATDLGNGYIEEVSINIDTNLANVELRYEPG